MMTRLGWHRSNRNLRNLYPVRDHSHSRILHGGVCVDAIPGQAVRLGGGVLLRQHRTKPGTLERGCGGFGVRRLDNFRSQLHRTRCADLVREAMDGTGE